MKTRQPDAQRSQRGVTLIWLAFFLLVMLAFIGLGVDMAKLMATRNQLQSAADAAALAGATAYASASSDSDAVKEAAAARAAGFAPNNRAFEDAPTPVVVPPEDILTNYAQKTVRVVARREGTTGVITYFAKVFPGLGRVPMMAGATAKGEGGCSLLPVAGQPEPGPEFIVGCTEYRLRYQGGSGTEGSFGGLDLNYDQTKNPNVPQCADDECGNGGSGYRCRLTYGFPCCVDSPACIRSQTGVSCGNTAHGIDDRFQQDTDKLDHDCYDDYTGNGMRYVTIPITDALPPGSAGSNGCYNLVRYGRFFLTRNPWPMTGQDQCVIYVNFLGYERAGGPTTSNFHVFLIR